MKDNHQSANIEETSSGTDSIFDDDFEDDLISLTPLSFNEAMQMNQCIKDNSFPVFGMMQESKPLETTHLPPISSILQYIDETILN